MSCFFVCLFLTVCSYLRLIVYYSIELALDEIAPLMMNTVFFFFSTETNKETRCNGTMFSIHLCLHCAPLNEIPLQEHWNYIYTNTHTQIKTVRCQQNCSQAGRYQNTLVLLSRTLSAELQPCRSIAEHNTEEFNCLLPEDWAEP